MIKCPVCGSEKEKISKCKVTIIYGTEFDLVKCTDCEVIFFNPLPTVYQLNEFYSTSYYNFDRFKEENKGKFFAKYNLRRFKKVGRFLDIGCATGFFINGIKNNSNWEVYGVEFSKDAVNFAKERLSLDVRQGELNTANFPASFFDYIHINNVLEHVLNPVSLLKECSRIIKPDGKLFLSVPNGFNDSLPLINFYKEENIPAYSKDGHIFFFPSKTLFYLFNHSGFIIERKATYSLKRGLRNIGFLPKKKRWKEGYFPRIKEEIQKDSIVISDKYTKHSNFYYYYKFILGNQHILGLYNFGLDFLFILAKS